MSNKIYINDTKTEIKLDAGQDISTQTTLEIHWKAPDDTTGEWTASLNADNQTVEYTNPNPWLIAGIWKFQIYVELPDWEGNGETYERKIYDLFE